MAVTYPREINGIYTGNLDMTRVSMIDKIVGMNSIPSLKNFIYCFPPELILNAIKAGMGVRKYCDINNIDKKQYVGELRDYQTTGAAFMYYSPRSILGDGVGIGKTVEVAALLNVLYAKKELTKFIMAVETSAVGQVQSELMKFTGLNVIELASTSDKMEKQIAKTNWDDIDGIVVKHSGLKSNIMSSWLAEHIDANGVCNMFNTIIIDESSVVKNSGTKMYTYAENICNIMPRVHFLNATTFEICIMDIYNQVDIMNPTVLPKKWRIEKEYCIYNMKPFWIKRNGAPEQKFSRKLSGYKNQEAFKKSLKYFYFARSKQEALGDSGHTYRVEEVEPTIEQLVAIKRKYRYNEVLNCPSLLGYSKIQFTRHDVPKLDRLIDMIDKEYRGQKVMIYCFHVDAQSYIVKELENIGIKAEILNGETKDTERKGIIDRFNTGDTEVLVTNIKKSLNLYNGDVCIFYSTLASTANMFQVAGRIDRNVDDRKKTYVLMLYKGTPEYDYITNVVASRGKDSRDLTIDAKSTIDYFIESLGDDNE